MAETIHTRTAEGMYVDGVWQEVFPEYSKILATVQPVLGKELELEQDGVRYAHLYRVVSETALGTEVLYRGSTYKVIKQAHWSHLTISTIGA